METTRTQIPGLGSYLLALFLTPIYCLTRGKYLGFVLSTILYILAIFTFLFFGLGIIFWALAALPAAFSLRNEIIEAHASRTGEATAQVLKAAGIGSANQTNSIAKIRPQVSNENHGPPRLDQNDQKTCPMCAESVKAAAVICKHCCHEFNKNEETVTELIPTLKQSQQPPKEIIATSSGNDGNIHTMTVEMIINRICSKCGVNSLPDSLFCIDYGNKL